MVIFYYVLYIWNEDEIMPPGILEVMHTANKYELEREEIMSMMWSNELSIKDEDISLFVCAIASAMLIGILEKMRKKDE
jgi:hypothetical protein